VKKLGAEGKVEVAKKGRSKGSKGARRINPQLLPDLGGGQDGNVVDLVEGVEFELEPKPEHRNMARELALLFDDTDGTIHRLVHVGWNPETKQMMGLFYNVHERQTMPKTLVGI
jgi:hypothetical protein